MAYVHINWRREWREARAPSCALLQACCSGLIETPEPACSTNGNTWNVQISPTIQCCGITIKGEERGRRSEREGGCGCKAESVACSDRVGGRWGGGGGWTRLEARKVWGHVFTHKKGVEYLPFLSRKVVYHSKGIVTGG